MKKTLILICVLFVQIIFAQKHLTRTGITSFKASVDTFEPVEAINNSTTVILNIDTGEIASLIFIKAFKFKVALMQEHFNENYMESDKYPKATFRGKIHGFDINEIDTEKEYKLSGEISFHGISKEIDVLCRIIKKDKTIYLKSEFEVQPQDFNIEIPNIVRKKIAKKTKISLDYEFSKKK